MASKETEPAPSSYDDERTPSQHSIIPDSEKASGDPSGVNPAPEGGLQAWLCAAGAAAIFLCTLGLANSFGAFEEYYLTHQLKTDSASKISWIGSLQSFLQFFAGMLGGPLFDRYGQWVIFPSAIIYIFAIMMLSLCKTYWQFMLTQGILMGIVMGFLQIPAFAAVSQYFDKKRAAALGLAVSGSSIGGIIMPIILSRMLNDSSLGFAWSVRVVGFVILPFMLLSSVAVKPRVPPRKTQVFLLSPYKDRRFILLFTALFFMFMGMFTPFFYLTTYATTQGMGAAMAGYLLAIVNAASTIGRIVPGILADKYGKLNTFAIGGISTGIIVFCMTSATSNPGLIAYSVFFGFTSGTIISGASAAFSSCPKEARDIGTYMGMGMAISGLGALIGPPINGAILNTYGNFFQVCMFSGTMAVVGGFIAFAAKLSTDEDLWGWV
ncbi:major facilitator superfamily domain-containing protein [Aspergillus alliaceus]|uniref:Major facilitator superfamily domain-containing protein n=1 Tax=Petromyces alliaceus TaxID=209559 RepID=A0A5N7CFT4_PETAA|nr:major facilitator superfamily domain-containing protein [Aspergillus alliaceus]